MDQSKYHYCKLVSFNSFDQEIYTSEDECSENDEESSISKFSCCNKEYVIQLFGLDQNKKTSMVLVKNFNPYFFIKVDDTWTRSHMTRLISDMYRSVGFKSDYYADTIVNYKLVKYKKLYGFNGGKKCQFVKVSFINEQAFKKFKRLWYTDLGQDKEPQLTTFTSNKYKTELYEAKITPILKFFHDNNISPSGWIKIDKSKLNRSDIKTSCTYSYQVDYKNIESDIDNETSVPYKIMSFDIEASSSHGDFPLAEKDYYKLAENIVDLNNYDISLLDILRAAYGFSDKISDMIDIVYLKNQIQESQLNIYIEKIYKSEITQNDISKNENLVSYKRYNWEKLKSNSFAKLKRNIKIQIINTLLTKNLPTIRGDEVTFIGSTFLYNGDKLPYLNHIISKDTCTNRDDEIDNFCVDSYKTEREVLLAWTKLIQQHDPDIIIGYNIMGFDYSFLYTRAKQLNCEREFLKMSRNKNEICWKKDWFSETYNIANSSIVLASGQHNLRYINMPGRMQIDLYNYFRKDYNLISYKLDYVAGYFIGDYIKSVELDKITKTTKITSKNLSGLAVGNFVCFEIETHSIDSYKNKEKFKVIDCNNLEGNFTIDSYEDFDLSNKATKIKWGLAKDDVTPQDIFRLTNQGPDERYIVAKYCINDCNLVHHLMTKVDVITGYTEMSKLCSVPMEYLVMRGQGIKLTSYMSKKCREMETLMPVLNRANIDEGYEGAIVLKPKCGLYLDDPVACVDYSSLYPSSMISENISPDSKVWTKEYNLDGKLVKTTGEVDKQGKFIYDDLPGYEYVDVEYDVYTWKNKPNTKTVVKTMTGTKICRFAQFPNNQRGIIPSILSDCLKARKATRRLIPNEHDPFMRNVLDKRQLSIKLTANSIYGQCGAKTSSFYEQDVAASTTATGRLLLIYAKKVIESAYKNRKINTKAFGECIVNAEYVYGDTDSVFFKFNPTDINGNKIIGKKALEITIELAKEAGMLASKFLKNPQDLEYEKTFWPYLLLSKKRYVGMLYEEDVNKCKRKSMGIVLKRRDNAPIVKDIYGGIIDILMKTQKIEDAIRFLKTSLNNLINGNINIEKLLISKSLRGEYKDPTKIAHKVLADRIGDRNPGNKPKVGDRIAYIHIKTDKPKALQGDRIETREYIESNNLDIDYKHYITNQIMKPIIQVFALVLEDIWDFKKLKGRTLKKWHIQLQDLKKLYKNTDDYDNAVLKLKDKETEALLFKSIISKLNIPKYSNTIDRYFK